MTTEREDMMFHHGEDPDGPVMSFMKSAAEKGSGNPDASGEHPAVPARVDAIRGMVKEKKEIRNAAHIAHSL